MRLIQTDTELPVDSTTDVPQPLPPRPERRRAVTSMLVILIVLVGMVIAIFFFLPKRQNLLMSEAISAHQEPPAWQLASPSLGEVKAWWLGLLGEKAKLPVVSERLVPLGTYRKVLHRRDTAIARFAVDGTEVTLLIQRTPGMAPRHKERVVGELSAVEWAIGPWAYVVVGATATAATWKPLFGVPAKPLMPWSEQAGVVTPPAAAVPVAPVYGKLPATLEAGRFFLTATTTTGMPVRFATDTGGGLFIKFAAASRLGLQVMTMPGDGGHMMAGVTLPALTPPLPPLMLTENAVPLLPGSGGMPKEMLSEFDVLLGQIWFRERIWTFDYLAGELHLHATAPAPTCGKTTPLYFRKDAQGAQTHHYPRIDVEVDGVALPMLFDTGATTMLTNEALAAMGDGQAPIRQTSFVAASVASRWHAAHPTWRWMDQAEVGSGAAMIEVPAVKIAGQEVGPVWFTVRPDARYHGASGMASSMDVQPDGAIGGSALSFFRIVADYPAGVAEFCTR